MKSVACTFLTFKHIILKYSRPTRPQAHRTDHKDKVKTIKMINTNFKEQHGCVSEAQDQNDPRPAKRMGTKPALLWSTVHLSHHQIQKRSSSKEFINDPSKTDHESLRPAEIHLPHSAPLTVICSSVQLLQASFYQAVFSFPSERE